MRYVFLALLSALLFGASTPVAKLLLQHLSPFQLAGLLYVGAAIGVSPFLMKEKGGVKPLSMNRKNQTRLLGAIGFGGIGGPVLLLLGLQTASSASVSMWLNLELVATALLGVLFFRDHLGRYGWIGVLGTILASLFISWSEERIGMYSLVIVALACICWGLDNHFTALIDGISASQSTFWKGIVAGSTNLVIGFGLEPMPEEIAPMTLALGVGMLSYGFSITLYIISAQHLGATRSQMFFGSAPFFGVLLSTLLLEESISSVSLIVLFRDQHSHEHTHEAIKHKHWHIHTDGHHTHEHPDGKTAIFHSHMHKHEPQVHSHTHWPDIHHRHKHDK